MTDIHSCSYYCARPGCIKAQRDELRERLAQPEQEPSGWKLVPLEPTQEMLRATEAGPVNYPSYCWKAMLYAAPNPPQRKPLTDGELADLWYKQSLDWMEFARAIEAAHGIKENT